MDYVYYAECGVRSAECGVRSAECGVRSAECGVRSVENEECGNGGVWKMGGGGMWKMQRVKSFQLIIFKLKKKSIA